MAEQYDLLLKGGDVVDPSQDLQQRYNVAFRHGRVVALAPNLSIEAAQEVISMSWASKCALTIGRLVQPTPFRPWKWHVKSLMPRRNK